MLPLLLAALLLAGCGSLDAPTPDASACRYSDCRPIPGPSVQVNPLRGALPVLLVATSYQDSPCPYDDLRTVAHNLNAFLARSSTGACWTQVRIVALRLPGTQADYAGNYTPDAMGGLESRLQDDCAEAAASAPEPYKIFILPADPVIYWGWGRADHRGGRCYLSALPWSPDPLRLPLPHEFGHALGFPHREGGVMSGTVPSAQTDWNSSFDPIARAECGWI